MDNPKGQIKSATYTSLLFSFGKSKRSTGNREPLIRRDASDLAG